MQNEIRSPGSELAHHLCAKRESAKEEGKGSTPPFLTPYG
jgi:hypothetical protein